MTQDISPEHIMQVGLGFWASKALLSAIEMELFTELAKHPEDLPKLSARLGLHSRSAQDFLDALVALGFLHRNNGKYQNAPDADLFLDKKKPSYIGGVLEMANHRLYGFWGNLTAALRTGESQNEAKGGGASPFVALYADPERLKQFLAAMTGISRGANMQIANKVAWEKYQTVADIGTAQG
ncbi:MAG: methyltransferase family protein, partial [Terriglobia bacterium]